MTNTPILRHDHKPPQKSNPRKQIHPCDTTKDPAPHVRVVADDEPRGPHALSDHQLHVPLQAREPPVVLVLQVGACLMVCLVLWIGGGLGFRSRDAFVVVGGGGVGLARLDSGEGRLWIGRSVPSFTHLHSNIYTYRRTSGGRARRGGWPCRASDGRRG